MPATDIAIPGLADIQTWAQYLGIDVTETVQRARMLMQTDPVTVRSTGDQAKILADRVGQRHQAIHLASSDVLPTWDGDAANAFRPYEHRVRTTVVDGQNSSQTLATHLGHVASVFEQSQNTVMTATGATATRLRMLRV